MTDPIQGLQILTEPLLQFGHGQMLPDPKDGLFLFGPMIDEAKPAENESRRHRHGRRDRAVQEVGGSDHGIYPGRKGGAASPGVSGLRSSLQDQMARQPRRDHLDFSGGLVEHSPDPGRPRTRVQDRRSLRPGHSQVPPRGGQRSGGLVCRDTGRRPPFLSAEVDRPLARTDQDQPEVLCSYGEELCAGAVDVRRGQPPPPSPTGTRSISTTSSRRGCSIRRWFFRSSGNQRSIRRASMRSAASRGCSRIPPTSPGTCRRPPSSRPGGAPGR